MSAARPLRRAAALSATLALLALGSPSAALAAEDGSPVIDGVVVEVPGIDTEVELDAYLLSDAARTVGLDPTSGQVTWVSAGQDSSRTASTSVKNVCKTGNACLLGPGVPFADFGFTDTGEVSGRWTDRIGVRTGSWKVNVTFSSGVTSATIAKNTTALFPTTQIVTKVKLSS